MTSPSGRHSFNALPSGTVLHDYVIESELGSGGLSIVYLARHRLNADWLFAIKEYFLRDLAVRDNDGASVRPVNTEAENALGDGFRRFRDEAKQLRRFRNERHIISCLNYFEANGTAYLVMDYDDGMPLSKFLERREAANQPFTEADLLAVVEPLLEGLTVVHRAGVLHRDIKPGNIYVRRPDDITGRPAQPVLIDFGAAKQNYLERHSRSWAPYTPEYAAYEQISSEGDIGPWTDIYAVGALMWRMVAGGCPDDKRLHMADAVQGSSVWSPYPRRADQRAFDVGRGRSDPMPSALDLGSERFASHILKSIDFCLALYPEDRVQSCDALIALLDQKSDQVTLSSEMSVKSSFATSSLRPGDKFRDGPDCPELVVVPAGTFWMGSPHRVWVPSGKTGLSETARHFLLCAGGAQPQTAERVLANARERLFGWIMRHEDSFGFPFRDVVDNSEWLDLETKTELQDGNLGWIEDCGLNRGLGRLADEALEAGSGFWMSGLDKTLTEFDEDYFYRLETAFADPDNGQFWASPDCEETVGDDEDELEFPGGFDGLSEEEGRDRWEGPMHRVTIGKPFAVGVYPITRGEFAAFVDATGFQAEGHSWSGDNDPTLFTWRHPGFHQTDSHPVVCVSWNDALEYIEWLSAMTGATYRLLSEAEWEYVARGGTSTPFHFGSTITTHEANYNGTSCYGSGVKGLYRQRTTPVWTFPANAFGLHDVHGNVREWTQDCCGSSYWNAPDDGRPWELERGGPGWEPNIDTQRATDIPEIRVIRGGCWASDASDLRSASRGCETVDETDNVIGFRVARELSS